MDFKGDEMNNEEKSYPVEIFKVANGYLVKPTTGPLRDPRDIDAQIHVFECFENMTVWLAEHFSRDAK
jgi:hypothetical protein